MAYLNHTPARTSAPVRIGLIGSGWMGAFHAESIARRVPGAELAAVARVLADAGYDGTVGMEAWASGDSQAALDAFRAAFTVSEDRVKAEV